MSERISYIDKIRKQIPIELYRELRTKIESTSEDKYKRIKELKLKNTYVTVILSLFLGIFGVDRFYAGDIKLGIGKLVMGFVGYIFGGFGTVGFTVQLLSYVWWIEDIFFSYRLSRKRNSEKIYGILNEN